MISLRSTFPFFFFLICALCQSQGTISHLTKIENQVYETSERSVILDQYQLLLKSLDSLERKPAKNIDTEIYLWTIKSAIEYKLGELRESEASSVNVLKLMDSSEESDWMNYARIRTYNILGILKKELVEYEKSLKYYRKVLTLTDDPTYLAGVYGNIGLVYARLEEYNLAISHYEKALELSKNLNNPELNARFLDDLGHAQSMINLPKAEATLINSLRIRDSLNLTDGKIYSHLHLSEHYFRNEDKSKALFHSEKALQIAKESKLIPLELTALENLLELEDERATQRFAFLTDSLKRVEQSSSNKFAEIRYGVALKEREAEQLRTKNRYYFIIFSTVTLLVILTSLLIYNRIRQRNKIAVINESINTEKRISARMHDEIANDLYHTMLGLQKVVPENEHLLNNLDRIYNRVRDISRDNSPLDPDNNFSKELEDLFIAYKNPDVNILTLNLTKMD